MSKTLAGVRAEKGITQSQCADSLNLSQQSYSKIETGKTALKVEHAVILAELFKVKMDVILQAYATTKSCYPGKKIS